MNTTSATEMDCPCGARDYELILDGSYNRLGCKDYRFRIFRCRSCGLARTDPMPDVTSYESEEYHEQEAFGGESHDVWSTPIAGFVASMTKPGRVLNVGAHTGNLHPPLERLGYEVVGLDIDPQAVEAARQQGRDVRLLDLLDAGLPESSFDVVIMIHTLEHLADPNAIVRECARVLRPGGHLFINVPNRLGLLPRLMKDHWIGWVPPYHVWQFDRSTLRDLVHRSGSFDTVHLRALGSMEPPSTGAKGTIKRIVSGLAHRTGWGDQVVAVFRRR